MQLRQIDNRYAVNLTDFAVGRFTLSFRHHSGNALRNCLRNETASINLMACNSDKQIARSRNAAIQGHVTQWARRRAWHPGAE